MNKKFESVIIFLGMMSFRLRTPLISKAKEKQKISEAQNINDWENPDINGINKEKPHAYNFLFEEKANNSLIQSLNGIWKFKWSPDPQSRPVDFYKENYSTENCDNILVPGNWQLQGFGTPSYTNITYPFKRDLGGDDTWGAKTMEKYTNPGNKPYHYKFILEYAE